MIYNNALTRILPLAVLFGTQGKAFISFGQLLFYLILGSWTLTIYTIDTIYAIYTIDTIDIINFSKRILPLAALFGTQLKALLSLGRPLFYLILGVPATNKMLIYVLDPVVNAN